MRAVAMVSVGNVEVVDDWPEPPCAPDEVVVAVRGTGVCGSDLAVVQGERPVPDLPWILGHEAFGAIVAVGRDIHDRKVGERVVIEPNYPCLECEQCLAGTTSGCRERRIAGISEPGLLAERVSVPARFAWPVPDAWPDADLVCVEPLTVALGAVRRSGVRPGERCLVVGAGSQGLLVCLALLRVGAVPFVTDPHPGRVQLALRIGARDATGMRSGTRFPVVIETAGVPEAFESALDRTESGGCLVVVGQSARPARMSTLTLVQRRLTVAGCLIYDHPGGFAQTLAELRREGLRPGRVVGARFSLPDAPRAFAQATQVAGKSWICLAQPEEVAP
jgi:threonine dehydrogenase-like Zn-dependent dehydrogenase